MTSSTRRSTGRAFRWFTSMVLLLSLAGAAPVSAAQKAAPPPRFGFKYVVLSSGLAADLGLDQGLKGLAIIWVYQGAPAEAAGLKPGDVLVKVGRAKTKPTAVSDGASYQAATKKLRADQDWTLYVVRGGQEKAITLRPSTAEFGPPLQPPPNAQPATLKAAADGSGDFRTLAGALFKARPGDTILLVGAHDAASVSLNNLTLASLDPAAPAEVAGLEITAASGVRIKGLRLGGDPKQTQSAVGVHIHEAKGVTVESCAIQGFNAGITVANSEGVVIEDNRISQNATGVSAYFSGVRISRNVVFRNARSSGWGFLGGILISSGKAEITQNTVLENQVPPDPFPGTAGVGIMILNDAAAVVSNNIVANNSIGVMVGPNAQATVEYNDVFGQFIQSKTWTRGNNEYHVQGGQANFLSEIAYEYKPQPIFPILNFDPNRHYYTLVLRFQPSQTNLSVDPLFVDRLNGDFRLAPDSPLVNRGRGGTHIGALPPLAAPTQASPVRGSAAAPPAAPVSPAASPGAAPSPPQPAAPPAAWRAWVHANTLYVQAEAADALVARLRQRLAESPQALDRVTKASIGVVPPALTGGESLSLSPDLAEDLTNALINAGLRPADAGPVKKAMAELAVKDSGQVDQSLGRDLAQRANCRFLLLGSVSDRGPTLLLNVRLLDAETGEYLAAERLELARQTD